MFRNSTARLSLLFLAFVLLPSGTLYADAGNSNIVIGTDPSPSGEPHPSAMGNLWLDIQLGMMIVL